MFKSLKETVRRSLPVKTLESPRIGLVDLPAEVLLCICQHLCPHCLGLPLTRHPTLVENKYLQSLKAFSQTAQRYRTVVRPFLFHRPRFGLNPGSDFINECIWNHDTASQVKELHGFARFYTATNFTLPGLLRWHAKNFLIRARLSRSQLEPFNLGSVENSVAIVMASARLNLITAPNIEVLSLTVGVGDALSYWDKDRQLLDIIDRGDGIRNPELKRLRALRLRGRWNFFEFHQAYRLIELVTPPHPSLTEVTFMGCMTFTHQITAHQSEVLARFLQGIKCLRFYHAWFGVNDRPYNRVPIIMIGLILSLETFVLKTARNKHGQGKYYISPQYLTNALYRHRDSLTYLDLDISYRPILHPPSEYPATMLGPARISAFWNLRTLKLHETAFCRHWCDGIPGFQGPTDPFCLTTLIGSNLRHVSITVAHRSRVTPDVINLAVSTSNGTYKSLETLELVYEPYRDGRQHLLWYELASSRRAIKKAFQAMSIEVIFTKLENIFAESCEMTPPPTGPQTMTEAAVNAHYETGRECLLSLEEDQEGVQQERSGARTV